MENHIISETENSFDQKRSELEKWREKIPSNFYSSNEFLKKTLLFYFGEDELKKHTPLLTQVGEDAATTLNEWAIETNLDENLPKIRRFDDYGKRIEKITFHPHYHEMGRKIYGSKIMSMYETPGLDIIQLALFYLYAHNGESGHCCPLSCTTGAIKIIQAAGSDHLKKNVLPKLLDPNYDTHYHGSQFLTEIQGGSDLAQTQTTAVKDKNGVWRLYGEKFFCSVIDAQVWVLTARPQGAPDGTAGLTAFIALRNLDDGSPNHFELKKLKNKIGTRSMATAEIKLNGLIAEPLGQPGEGFKYVLEYVLNTSRLYNSFAAAGITQRAFIEAQSYAESRTAFGQPIKQYPLVKRSLQFLENEAQLQLSTNFRLAHLAALIATKKASKDEEKTFRFLVNANKYWTSIQATRATREAIEVLGGNGTMEEFSVLPRLYRDAIVLESWEGAHNVLCMQILKDMHKYEVHLSYFNIIKNDLNSLKSLESKDSLDARLHELQKKSTQLLKSDPMLIQCEFRNWTGEVMELTQAIDRLKVH